MGYGTVEETTAVKLASSFAKRLGKIVTGRAHSIGEGFTALHFSEEMFDGNMDPLLMVDDFVMTGPTFEPHLHAGISAVTSWSACRRTVALPGLTCRL